VRDDFTKQTIADIAKGVGYRCSNPDCTRPTVAANAAQDGIITIGVAAHVCAASPGGPRFNAAQTPEARRGRDNGLWLCQNCGRLIDADPQRFTVEVLTGWKHTAQSRAFRELVVPGTASPTEEAARIGHLVAIDNSSDADAKSDELFVKVHTAAANDLAAFKRGPIWSGSTVELTLRLQNDPSAPSFNISKLPPALEIAPEVTIIAPPGTGKTTTLLQLAGYVLANNSIIPIYFRLGDWAAGSSTLLESLHHRSAFQDVGPNDVRELARRGRVLLLLDGWNELDPDARKKLRLEITQLRHDYPHMRLVATTRRQFLDVPTSGPRVVIEPLSEDQELTIAHAQHGAAGEKIVDDAWRTAGVRELIATPLYLSALLSGGTQDPSPTTKEELLRLFVEQHERASEHAEALQATLFGCHTAVLTALASHLNAAGSTTMNEAESRRIVTSTITRLREQGQISGKPEPIAVLEVLTNHHTLMRSGSGSGSIAFQHQQFQEWFASHEVAELMRASADGHSSAQVQLREAVFDQPAWEESVFFAVESVSRADGGAAVTAYAIRLALAVDPMLAAEMIYRTTADVWEIVKSDILAFIDRWHQPGEVDRAVRFMIITGRPEFAPLIWPLASSNDNQIQLPTLRTAPRFRPSVLGPNLVSKVASLPEDTREHLLALIASESGVDGMDLATELAKADPSPKIQAEVVQYLQFRRADRHVAMLLAQAHDQTWALVAKRGYAEEIRNPAVAKRMREEREKALAAASEPLERLRLLLEQSPDYPERDAGIAAAIADPGYLVRDQHGSTSIYYAQERAPAAVLSGLWQRLEAGLELPFHADEFLEQLEVTDEGPIATAVLDVSSDRPNAIPIMAGPKTVGELIDKFLACSKALKSDRNNQAIGKEYHRIRDRIIAARAPSVVAAVLTRSETDDPNLIASLASLVSLHGNYDERNLPIPVDPTLKPRLIDMLRRWVGAVIASPIGGRYELNEVSNAIGRFGFRELLPELTRLLDEDLARLRKATAGVTDARRRGDIIATSDASMRYGNQYREAFARLGGDETAAVAADYLEDESFGFDASLVLKAISDKQLNVPESNSHRQWPWLDEVAAARAARAVVPKPPPANAVAEPIFAAISSLAKSENEGSRQLLAIQLTRIALAMPHGDQDALVSRVMALPQPLKVKRELAAAIALDGQILDAKIVLQAIDEWLTEAQTNEWHSKQETWAIEPWLGLLPFTNHPEAVLDGLTKVKAFYGSGWAKRWERVLRAVASLPGPEGDALLTTLAKSHKDIAGDYEWMKAILTRGTLEAVLLYVDLYIDGTLGRDPDGTDAWHVARELAAYVPKLPGLRAKLKKRYGAAGTGPARAMFEYLFGEIGDGDDLMTMVKKYAARGHTYDGRVAAAVRSVALRHEPVGDGSNSFNIHPASVGPIRKNLFGLLGGTSPEAALAKSCLIAIDELRDEYGIAANDTRHPDVKSETPWPTEAGP
jgi:hypothetical protein